MRPRSPSNQGRQPGSVETGLLAQYPEAKPGLGHAHPDSGTFTLFAKGVFLANGDTAYVGKKGDGQYKFDPGRWDPGRRTGGAPPWATFDDRPYSDYDRIHMDNVWLGPRIAASTAVFPSAYRDELKITKMNRQLVLVDGRFLLVRDSIASDLPHQYQWMLHGDKELANPRANRFVMENGPGRLVVEHLLPIDSFKTGPAIVETELYDPKRSRPQQRGFQLEVQSPPNKKNFEFLAAMNIQSSQDSPDGFLVKQNADGSVSAMSDKTGRCVIWTKGASGLNGSYAYILQDTKGAIISAGLSGTSLTGKDLQIQMKSPGQVSIQLGSGGAWKIEAPEGAPNPDVRITPPRPH